MLLPNLTPKAWVLEPGDALYLPPRVAHHGVSLDEVCPVSTPLMLFSLKIVVAFGGFFLLLMVILLVKRNKIEWSS